MTYEEGLATYGVGCYDGREHPVIYIPALTFQYSEAGDMDHSSMLAMDFDETVRDRFKAYFYDRYADYEKRHAQAPGFAWNRLVELTREAAAKPALHDNPHILTNMWLIGELKEMPECLERLSGRLAKYRTSLAARKAEAELQEQEERELRSKVSCKTSRVIYHKSEMDDDAISVEAEVTILATGETLAFSCRNIFDFGYVVNPAYAIAPGLKGGLAIKDQWHDFAAGKGWYPVRPLTEAETLALRYLHTFPPVSDEVRL